MGGKITIRKKMDDYSISLDVFGEDGGVIVSYSFKSITAGTDVGKRLVLITLLRYSIMMTLNVEEILVDFEISKYEADYIQGEIDNFVYYSKINHNLAMKKPIIVYRNIAENFKYKDIFLNPEINFIGYSGGKDSTLCLEIIKDEFKEIRKFKIDFETEDFLNDYNERIDIIDYDKYNLIATSKFYELNNRDYYQEEDLHCCFAIPYFSVQSGYPASLTIGLQFDVVNSYVFDEQGNPVFEYDLLETYESLKCFERLMHFYGLSKFRVFVPLASLTSFSIYNILRKEYGEEGLRQFNSCWTPERDGSPCGKCLKCQRVSFIYSLIGMKLTEKEKESLSLIKKNDVKVEYLFGSITCKNLLEIYSGDKREILSSALFVDEKIEDLDWGINRNIKNKYKLISIMNPLRR